MFEVGEVVPCYSFCMDRPKIVVAINSKKKLFLDVVIRSVFFSSCRNAPNGIEPASQA